jgi:hypothetical protein
MTCLRIEPYLAELANREVNDAAVSLICALGTNEKLIGKNATFRIEFDHSRCKFGANDSV